MEPVTRSSLPSDVAEGIAALPTQRGMSLLEHPLLNKGTAFTDAERSALGLHGLLPAQVETLEQQVVRAYEAFRRKSDDLERHIYLRALQDTNEVLFYRLLLDHADEMVPIVYTPTVALGCQQFSHIYRRPRGLVIPYPLRDAIPELLRNRPNPNVDVLVVTDGERILGIGDQGVGGLGIPIGKLSLYTLIGGIPPDRTLPVVLDVGTNNRERLKDPEYLGWRHERIAGPAYDEFVERFVRAVRQELPGALLQWEDIGAAHARPLLERYRDRVLSFNDDIQGTGAVVLGTLLAALRIAGAPLRSQRIVLLGAGSAGVGVAEVLLETLVGEGVPEGEARQALWLVNRGGLLHEGRTDLSEGQRRFAKPWAEVAPWAGPKPRPVTLSEIVWDVHPTILLGLSTVGGAFDENLVQEMAARVPRPIIFPLSNPTANAEAVPRDLIAWTEGRGIIATGSPFAPVVFEGRTIPVSQCNNVYVFPGLGLGALASGARRVSGGMVLAAARALAELSPALHDSNAPLLPPIAELRATTLLIAQAVGEEAVRSGRAPPVSPEQLRLRIAARRWSPVYPRYAPDPQTPAAPDGPPVPTVPAGWPGPPPVVGPGDAGANGARSPEPRPSGAAPSGR